VGARVVIRAAAWCAIVVGATACIDPDYHCQRDSDCDVGAAGRCEIDHRCTAIDEVCATHRRYSAHAGAQSGQCFDDQITPLDLCAAGQPPAPPTGCAASVCAALPTCCATGWSEACVQQAQIACGDLQCDTRIAITATKPGHSELWDVRWDGATWTAERDPRQAVLAWLAPARGATEPQLASFTAGALVTDTLTVAGAAGRTYAEATPVDFDRDGRPTAVLGFADDAGTHLEVVKLDDGSARLIPTTAAIRLAWGDVDHDAFPDGIAAEGASTRYHLLSNIADDQFARVVDDRVVTNVTNGTSVITDPPPALRGFDWLDLDGDHALDVVAYGYSVDVHPGKGDAIGTTVLLHIDCDPPGPSASCDATQQMAQAFAGAGLPATAGPSLVLASQPARALYRAQLTATAPVGLALAPYAFPTEACGDACAPILAVVARDLDGDHALDVIAIDANLQIYTGLAKDGGVLHAAVKLATSPAEPGFLAVRTSVTGAPR
jgi:hypothetical protein